METILFSDWEKLDLRVGEIENIEDIEGADKLYKLTINIREETRTICAGIKQFYSHDDLRGKKVIVLANLAPKKMKGIMSEGMILAAAENDKKVILLSPESDIGSGTKVR